MIISTSNCSLRRSLLAMLLLTFTGGWAMASELPVQLVESFPIETTLDNPDIPEAHATWLEMIQSAERSIDLAHFYASNAPDSRLEPIIAALEEAAGRGVHIRFLSDLGFVATYPETLARLDAHASIDVRPLDLRSLTGGVLHAKMMLIDGDDAFVGSQNFDWRALEHIQELGLRISDARLVLPLVDLFEKDWALAGGEVATPAAADYELPLRGDGWSIRPVMSPRGQLVDESLWDLPRLIEAIDGAKTQLRLQMLSYRTTSRDGSYWDELDAALRRASARGVDLRLIFSNWSTSRGSIETLQSLQTLPNIEVRITTIPEWSGGFIPFARVSHSKYLVIDEAVLWIGTSNGSRGYFYDSRNVGFLIESKSLAQRLIAYFQHTWESAYAETVDPCAQYTAPRRG